MSLFDKQKLAQEVLVLLQTWENSGFSPEALVVAAATLSATQEIPEKAAVGLFQSSYQLMVEIRKKSGS